MKTKSLLLALCATCCATLADTNSISISPDWAKKHTREPATNQPPATSSLNGTNLNAHQRFYVNYRAENALFERTLSGLQAQRAKLTEAIAYKLNARIDNTAEHNARNLVDQQIAGVKRQIAALDVQRLEYERRYPDAVQYRGVTPKPPEGPTWLEKRYFPSAR